MSVFLGIDCGGTSTRAVIASPTGQILGVGTGAGGNPNASGIDGATQSIKDATSAALLQARADQTKIAAAFVGMAGVVGEDDLHLGRSIVRHALPNLHASRLGLDHDIRIALAGGLPGQEGLALIVGTGSSCYGRTRDGRTWQSGGWGSILDDGGSAHALGLAAMKAAVRLADARLPLNPNSPLLREVLRALGLSEIRQIVDRVYRTGMSKSEVAALAPIVISSWQSGDKIATDIIHDELFELDWIVRTTAAQLDLASPNICYSGGLIENSPEYAQALTSEIQISLPAATLHPAALPPVLGAVLLAYDLAGNAHDPRTWDSLSKSLAR